MRATLRRLRSLALGLAFAAGCASAPTPDLPSPGPGGPAPGGPHDPFEFTRPGAAPPTPARDAYRAAQALVAAGRFDAAGRTLEALLASETARVGADATALARPLAALAQVHVLAGDPALARPLFARAAALLERGDPPEARALAFVLGRLADCELRLHDDAAARGHLERALALHGAIPDPDPRELGALLASLASLDARAGDDAAARPRYEQALDVLARTDAEPPLLARLELQAGLGALRLGDVDAALAHLERSLERRNAGPGGRERERLLNLELLGTLLAERDAPQRARPLLERALDLRERTDADPVALGRTLSVYGRVQAALGDGAGARTSFERALALLEPALGKLDPLTLTTRAHYEKLRARSVEER